MQGRLKKQVSNTVTLTAMRARQEAEAGKHAPSVEEFLVRFLLLAADLRPVTCTAPPIHGTWAPCSRETPVFPCAKIRLPTPATPTFN
jgi:hypothetical protein